MNDGPILPIERIVYDALDALDETAAPAATPAEAPLAPAATAAAAAPAPSGTLQPTSGAFGAVMLRHGLEAQAATASDSPGAQRAAAIEAALQGGRPGEVRRLAFEMLSPFNVGHRHTPADVKNMSETIVALARNGSLADFQKSLDKTDDQVQARADPRAPCRDPYLGAADLYITNSGSHAAVDAWWAARKQA